MASIRALPTLLGSSSRLEQWKVAECKKASPGFMDDRPYMLAAHGHGSLPSADARNAHSPWRSSTPPMRSDRLAKQGYSKQGYLKQDHSWLSTPSANVLQRSASQPAKNGSTWAPKEIVKNSSGHLSKPLGASLKEAWGEEHLENTADSCAGDADSECLRPFSRRGLRHPLKHKANSQRNAPRASSETRLTRVNSTTSEATGSTSKAAVLHHASSWPVSKRKMRHQAVMEKAHHMELSATRIQSRWRSSRAVQDVALMRMIFSIARRRYQGRLTFQRRMAEKETEVAEGSAGEPTLYRLQQAPHILREVMHDVLYAVKACSRSKAFLEHIVHKDLEDEVTADTTRNDHENGMKQQQRWQAFTASVISKEVLDVKMANEKAQLEAESEWLYLCSTLDECGSPTKTAK